MLTQMRNQIKMLMLCYLEIIRHFMHNQTSSLACKHNIKALTINKQSNEIY